MRLKERISVATFNGRQGKESFAQKIFSGEEVERLVESIEKGKKRLAVSVVTVLSGFKMTKNEDGNEFVRKIR